jgi:hypothetical protein
MIEVFIESVGVITPGMVGWVEAQPILSGSTPYVWRELPTIAPAILPATERRRCIASARLALSSACEALATHTTETTRPVACVFASSDGDGQIIHQIADSLAQEEPDVSPIRFANSVHNAASGYWSIAAGLTQASTTICAFDDTFSAALLEAAVQTIDEQQDVLMTAYDMRFPEPFAALRPTALDCAISLLLTNQRTDKTMAKLQITLVEHCAATALPADLPSSFLSNPAAHGLPLLAALATPATQTIHLDYLNRSLMVTIQP